MIVMSFHPLNEVGSKSLFVGTLYGCNTDIDVTGYDGEMKFGDLGYRVYDVLKVGDQYMDFATSHTVCDQRVRYLQNHGDLCPLQAILAEESEGVKTSVDPLVCGRPKSIQAQKLLLPVEVSANKHRILR